MGRLIITLLLAVASYWDLSAQNDPVLAGMILAYTQKAEKELKSQERIMLMQTTGHLWVKEEVKANTNLQREFNNYLNSFRSIVSYAAHIYGFYYEIDRLIENIGSFSKRLDAHPDNSLAVALSTKRNKIYRELIIGSVEMVNDIRQVCMENTKMTEKERVEIVFGICPKLKMMNKKLQRLTIAVKYTSLAEIWVEIDEGSRDKTDVKQIVEDCMNRWKRSGRR